MEAENSKTTINVAPEQGKLYVIDILIGECADLQLVFKPKNSKVLKLELPVRIIGNPTLQYLSIKTDSLPAPLSVSSKSITFKNKVVFGRESNQVSIRSKESLHLKNNSRSVLKWSFDSKILEDCTVFSIEPNQGTLQPNDSITAPIFFKPEVPGRNKISVPLHIDKMNQKVPISIDIRGTGVEASLVLDPPQIFMPLTAVGETSTSAVSIINYGCERNEISFKFDLENIETFGSLEILFPEGNLLKGDGEKLTIVLKFTAKRPISFVFKVEFSTANQINPLFLSIKGACDCSYLSLQSLLFCEKRSVHDVSNQKIDRLNLLSSTQIFKTPLGLVLNSDTRDITEFYQDQGSSYCRWLQDNISTPLISSSVQFPESLTRNFVLPEIIFALSGKRMGSGPVTSLSNNFFNVSIIS